MAKIKIGIIGCGTIANSAHIPAYMANPDVEIKYFCDILPEKAKAAVEKYGCGIAVEPGNVGALADAIRGLAGDPARREVCGRRGRAYYEENFTKEAYVDRLEAELAALEKGRKR